MIIESMASGNWRRVKREMAGKMRSEVRATLEVRAKAEKVA
jgi:hypothetical protein